MLTLLCIIKKKKVKKSYVNALANKTKVIFVEQILNKVIIGKCFILSQLVLAHCVIHFYPFFSFS